MKKTLILCALALAACAPPARPVERPVYQPATVGTHRPGTGLDVGPWINGFGEVTYQEPSGALIEYQRQAQQITTEQFQRQFRR